MAAFALWVVSRCLREVPSHENVFHSQFRLLQVFAPFFEQVLQAVF